MRVWEYAKKCGMKTKDLIMLLDELNIYKSPQSNITEEEIQQANIQDIKEDCPIEPTEINTKDYYNIENLITEYPDGNYYIALSPRGVGKSTSALMLIIKTFLDKGGVSCLIRRRDEELNGQKFRQMFSEIEAMGLISTWSHGYYNSLHTIGPRAYLCKRDEDGKIEYKAENWFCYAISLNTSMNIKSVQFNRDSEGVYVEYIVFDELIPTDNNYIPREDEIFFNCVSTIIRHYDKCRILLFGNTIVTSTPPILDMMGIDMYSLKIGEKREYVYTSDDETTKNKVIVEYVDKTKFRGISGKNNQYFTFNNQKLAQISGINDGIYGTWELSKSYDAKFRDYKRANILLTFYWIYGEEIYAGDVVQLPDCRFIFTHKTGHKLGEGWLDESKELIFSSIHDPRKNWVSSLCNTQIKRVSKIVELIKENRICHQNAWLSYYFQSLFDTL